MMKIDDEKIVDTVNVINNFQANGDEKIVH